MKSSTITVLPLFMLGAIAQSTTSIFWPAETADNNKYAGSVVGTTGGLTTYAISCTSGSDNCVTGEIVGDSYSILKMYTC